MSELAMRPGPGRAILHRWFVQYNPFYFASALLVLAGVFLLMRDPGDWEHGQLLLAAVVQLYELALIAGAALLFGLPGQRRPAVILAIVAMAFLFDASFRTEGLASVGMPALPASIAWALLLALKLDLLARALRVRIALLHRAMWALAGFGLAAAPQLIAAGIAPAAVLTGACWLGIALVLLALSSLPSVFSVEPLDEWGRVVAARLGRLAPVLWAAMYWAHLALWCGIHELRLTPACFAPLVVLLPNLLARESLVWAASAVALGVAAASPQHFGTVAALLALGLAIKAYRAGWPRLYVLAIVAGAAPAIPPLLPATLAHWGALSLGTGFLALAAGLALNWWAASRSRFAGSADPSAP